MQRSDRQAAHSQPVERPAWEIDADEHRKVRQLARSIEAKAEDAEDLEQDLWLAALQARPAKGTSRLPWFATVARRIRASQIRRSIRRSDRESLYAEDRETGGSDPTPSPAGAWGVLGRAAAALPLDKQTVVKLRYNDGLSFAEIGRRMQIPESTARSHHRRALETLRLDLADSRESHDHRNPLAGVFCWLRSLSSQQVTTKAMLAIAGTFLVAVITPWASYVSELPAPAAEAHVSLTAASSNRARPDTDDGHPSPAVILPGVPPERRKLGTEPNALTTPPTTATTLAGRVLVVDRHGASIPGARLRVFRGKPGEERPKELPVPIVANEEGLALVPYQGPGAWVVAEAGSKRRSRALLLDFLHMSQRPFELEVIDEPKAWECRVVDGEAKPIEGAVIRVGVPTLQGIARASTLTPTTALHDASAVSDLAGRALVPIIDDLGPRSVQWVSARGFATTTFVGQLAQVELSPSRTLYGVVLEPSGTPSTGALVHMTLTETDMSWKTTTGPDGRFSIPGAPRGSVELQVLGDRGGRVVVVDLGEQIEDALVVQLNQSHLIHARVSLLVDSHSTRACAELIPGWHSETSLLAQHEFRRRYGRGPGSYTGAKATLLRRNARGDVLRLLDQETNRILAVQSLGNETSNVVALVEREVRERTLQGRVCGTRAGQPNPSHLIAASEWSSSPWLIPVDPGSGEFVAHKVPEGDLWLQPVLAPTAGNPPSNSLPLRITRVTVHRDTEFIKAELPTRPIRLRAIGPDGNPIAGLRACILEGHVIHRGDSNAASAGQLEFGPDGTLSIYPVSSEDIHATIWSMDYRLVGTVHVAAGTSGTQAVSLSARPRQTVTIELPFQASEGVHDPCVRAEVRDASGRLIALRPVDAPNWGERCRVRTRLLPGPYTLTLDYGSHANLVYEFEVRSAEARTRERIEATRSR